MFLSVGEKCIVIRLKHSMGVNYKVLQIILFLILLNVPNFINMYIEDTLCSSQID